LLTGAILESVPAALSKAWPGAGFSLGFFSGAFGAGVLGWGCGGASGLASGFISENFGAAGFSC
jgi:hypothetical protein